MINKYFCCLGALLFTLITNTSYAQLSNKYDIVVYGGTAGGFTAAIQAAKMGKSVILIEPTNHIGGNAVEGLGGTDIDNHNNFQNSKAVGGMALEFYKRLAKEYSNAAAFEKMLLYKEKNSKLWLFESSVAEKVIKAWLAEYPNINLLYQTRLSELNAVKKNGTTIQSIKTENGRIITGKLFIDATIEGDLLAAAGVSNIIGREANVTYNETLNGIRGNNAYRQFEVRVDPYNIPGNPQSGLIPTIQDEPLGTPGEADKRIQAYCFRVCLTTDKNNQIPFIKPVNYDRKQYEIYLRYQKAGGKLYTPWYTLPNNKSDLGAWHDLSHNLYGMNKDYPAGNYATRKKILDQHKNFTQGLFYFLANDTAVAAITREKWANAGLCKDEFTDNEGFPRMFYVRDARRMVSDYVITEQMGSRTKNITVSDPVAVAYWPMDVHHTRRIVKDGAAYNEGFVFAGNYWQPFGISYRAMIPKVSECTNLITSTCLSSSHIAYGAFRTEFNFMELGQTAGIAASLSIEQKTSIQKVNYKKLKSILLQEHAVLDALTVGMPE